MTRMAHHAGGGLALIMSIPQEKPYDRDFFAFHHEPSSRSATEIVPKLIELLGAKSVIDIGCGNGTWLDVFQRCGIEDILGVDGDYVDRATLQIQPDRFRSPALGRPLDLGGRFDLAICLEVAEHLPEDRADTFIDSVTRHAPVVLFSGAIPGQGGTHHVNEQWPQYWANRFAERGYLAFDVIRPLLWDNPNVAWWYAQNAILYAQKAWVESRARFPQPGLSFCVKALVHPGLLAARCNDLHAMRNPSLRNVVKQFPAAVGSALANRLRRVDRPGMS